MWWLNKPLSRALRVVFYRTRPHAWLMCLPFLLCACGFEPMYAKPSDAQKGSASQVHAGVVVDPLPGRAGQIFKSSLEDLLNPDGTVTDAAYRLKASLKHVSIPISSARDGTVSRFNINFASQYVLYRRSDNQPVTSGTINYVTSYNNLANSYYSTYIAEQDALKRGTSALSELYRQRLAMYLDAGAPQSPNIVMPDDRPLLAPDEMLRQQQGNTINLR